jgi:hypothetical protein
MKECSIYTAISDNIKSYVNDRQKPIVDGNTILDRKYFGLFNQEFSRKIKEKYGVTMEGEVLTTQTSEVKGLRPDVYGYTKSYSTNRWFYNKPLVDLLEEKRRQVEEQEAAKEEKLKRVVELAQKIDSIGAIGLKDLSTVEEALFELSEQLVSSPSEAATALSMVDQEIADIALELFPAIPEVKSAVQELFDENPELANQVYEALGFRETGSISQLEKLKSYLKEEDYRLKTPAPSWVTDPTTSVGKMLEEINIPIIKDSIAFLRDQNQKIEKLKSNANLITNNLYVQADINPEKLLEDETTQVENILRTNRGEKRLETPELDKLNALKTSNRDLYEQIEDLGDQQITLIQQSSNAFEKEVRKFFNFLMEYEQKELGTTITPQQKQQALQAYSQYLDTIFPDSKVKDIVYHGTPFEFDTFKKPLDIKENIFNQHLIDDRNPEKINPDAIYFQFEAKPFRNGKVISAIINSKELIKKENYSGYSISYATGNRQKLEQQLNSKTFDALDITPTQGKRELLVFEPEQIHMLGTQEDIEGFKEFVKTQPTATETTMEPSIEDQLEDFKEENSNMPEEDAEDYFFGCKL